MLRVIVDKRRDPYMNMAIDEVLMEENGFNLRLYGWYPPAVTIGYFQSIKDFVNVEACKKLGILYTRRISGGGSVLHMYEVTYSITGDRKILGRWPEESFDIVLEFLIKALKNLGINAKKEGVNDIVVRRRKISGNAQARRDNRVLQHGTVLVDLDRELMDKVLKVSFVKSRNKGIIKVSDRVTSIREVLGKIPRREEIISAFINAATEFWGKVRISCYRDEELTRAEVIANERYRRQEWIFRR
ncbi:MAG: lipoate--protein ligase family protein [Euryarchaeota archaeon]|nr:lipoate--protein ligase family protein [Euryarchaeota archaeon]MCD6158437.1 lipoate--protein ligase family protein [Euryarchaeota archaeon]